VAEVVVVTAILEDEDMDLLEVDATRIETKGVPLKKDPGNASIIDAIITSSRSAGEI